jgi:hypothetical protein
MSVFTDVTNNVDTTVGVNDASAGSYFSLFVVWRQVPATEQPTDASGVSTMTVAAMWSLLAMLFAMIF